MKNSHEKDVVGALGDDEVPEDLIEIASNEGQEGSGDYKGRRVKNAKSRSFVKWSLYFILLGAVVATATILSLKFFVKDIQLPTPVASITQNMRDSTACEPFVKLEVKCKVEWVLNETKPRGDFVAKEINKGKTSVTLMYSAGSATPVMPIIEGLTLKDAEASLWRSGLRIGNAIEKEGPAARNVILKSGVKAGDKLKNGDAVDVYVSMGVVSVPDWRGKPLDLVEIEAKELGFQLKINRVPSDKPEDVVIAHVKYKKVVDFGSTLELNVSSEVEKSDETIVFPDLTGLSQVDAVATLAAKGFTKIVTNYANIEGDGKVIATFPVAGESASPKDTVVLTLTKKS